MLKIYLSSFAEAEKKTLYNINAKHLCGLYQKYTAKNK